MIMVIEESNRTEPQVDHVHVTQLSPFDFNTASRLNKFACRGASIKELRRNGYKSTDKGLGLLL